MIYRCEECGLILEEGSLIIEEYDEDPAAGMFENPMYEHYTVYHCPNCHSEDLEEVSYVEDLVTDLIDVEKGVDEREAVVSVVGVKFNVVLDEDGSFKLYYGDTMLKKIN